MHIDASAWFEMEGSKDGPRGLLHGHLYGRRMNEWVCMVSTTSFLAVYFPYDHLCVWCIA